MERWKKRKRADNIYLEISEHRKVAALPEEVTLFINGDKMEVIGDRPYYYFENGIMTKKLQKEVL